MTLQELNNKCYSSPGEWKPVTFYVFEDEDSADSWVDDNYNGGDNRSSTLVCVMRSDYTDNYYMKEDILNAEVEHFYAVEKDVIVVVIDFKRG